MIEYGIQKVNYALNFTGNKSAFYFLVFSAIYMQWQENLDQSQSYFSC